MLNKEISVVILAGGQSLRMDGNPKCMTFIKGKTIFEWQMDWLARNIPSPHSIVAMVGMNKDLISYFNKFGINACKEDEPLGDAGAIKLAFKFFEATYKGPGKRTLHDTFVLNGDTIFTFSFEDLYSHFSTSYGDLGCVVVKPFVSQLGVLKLAYDVLEDNVRIVDFKEKPMIADYWTSCGLYVLTPEIVKFLPDSGDFAKDVIAKNFDRFMAYRIGKDEWCAVESRKDIANAEKVLGSANLTKSNVIK